MQIVRGEQIPAQAGTTFTGPTTLARLLTADEPAGVNISMVRFEDGARTNWHVHPGEQVLYIVEGKGRVGTAEEQYELSVGDVVQLPPHERHWHGAAAGHSMAHLSITVGAGPQWFEAPED